MLYFVFLLALSPLKVMERFVLTSKGDSTELVNNKKNSLNNEENGNTYKEMFSSLYFIRTQWREELVPKSEDS